MARVNITTPQNAKQIAQQYGTTAKEIRRLNELDKGEKISGSVRLGRGVGPVTPSRAAESLYVDPTPAFQPAMDFINKQMGAANTRYAANQADIKSIFGNLSTVRAADKQKIQEQFTKSIADQQLALANRTAEARAGSQAGAQQLAVTAGERGQGPMPASSPVQLAAEEGIARSNEYQQTWAALQNVMNQQAQNDVQSAITGYGYQQASALEQLRNNLEERLAGLEGQQVDVQSQLAGAQLQGRQGVMQANYGEIQARQAQQAALAAAQARAGGSPKATGDYADILSFAKAEGQDPRLVADGIDEIDAGGYKNWQEAYSAWDAKYGDTKQGLKTRVKKYFQDNYSSSASSSGTGSYEKNIFGLQKRMNDEGVGNVYAPMMDIIRQIDGVANDYGEAMALWQESTANRPGSFANNALPYVQFYFQNLWSAPR